MNYNDFKLDKTVIEIRYGKAYLHWDRAGSLWNTIQDHWPNIENVEANPAKTVFRLNLETLYELTAELGASRVIAHSPKASLSEFQDVVEVFLSVVTEILEIREFDRLGFRFIHSYETNDRETANQLVAQMSLFKIPDGDFFGFKRKSVSPEIALVFFGDEVGTTIRISSQTHSLNFAPPPGFPQLHPVRSESHRIAFDVDYFTIAKVLVSQLKFSEWIPQIYRLVKRDCDRFLGGI